MIMKPEKTIKPKVKTKTMYHILDCEENELANFCINKTYRGKNIRIKHITDIPKSNKFYFNENEKMIIPHSGEIERKLYVFFELYTGLEINLGLIYQEMVFDEENFIFFVKSKLDSLSDYLKSI